MAWKQSTPDLSCPFANAGLSRTLYGNSKTRYVGERIVQPIGMPEREVLTVIEMWCSDLRSGTLQQNECDSFLKY